MSSSVNNRRRYYLLKRLYAREHDLDSERVWQSKQEGIIGTAFPATFPLISALSTAGYSTVEDLDGADAAELCVAGLTSHEATAVLAAFSAL